MPRKLTKKQRRAAIIELARKKHQKEGTIEIDDSAKLSEGDDNGCYVAAWVWVYFDGTPFDKEKNDTIHLPTQDGH